jgi:preprotein translocase subunit YajC
VDTWIYLIPLVILAAMLLYAQRARRRQLTQELDRANRIEVGTEVMTTSGLYGTVVARHDDGSVQLSIAPGVEVKWAIAALRDSDSIPPQYRRAIEPDAKVVDPVDRRRSEAD